MLSVLRILKLLPAFVVAENQSYLMRSKNILRKTFQTTTLFTGRTFEIKVYPFSFSEYLQYFGYTDKYNAFDKYVLEGGMSGSYLYKDQEAKYDYISEVFDTLIVRDIHKKYGLRQSA